MSTEPAAGQNKHRVRFANYIPTAISMLCKLAIRKRWRLDNPALDVEPLKVPKDGKSRICRGQIGPLI